MGREILFRGKRKSDGEWIFGNLLRTDDDGTCIIQNHVSHNLLKNYEVDPGSIGQYTGLADKNGRKIFEGDIIGHAISDTIGAVKWYSEDYLGWCVDDIYIGEQQFTGDMCAECKVIGNIFDNPELLNQ